MILSLGDNFKEIFSRVIYPVGIRYNFVENTMETTRKKHSRTRGIEHRGQSVQVTRR